jgi:hypothetical protein
MSDLELTMMRRVGELKAEVERLKKFNDEAMAHIAKEERKNRERLEMEQEENARLKAEVERLTAEVSYDKRCELHTDKLAAEFTQAQVERLTKAGDEMAADLIGEFGSYNSVYDWNAAKEGKGQP